MKAISPVSAVSVVAAVPGSSGGAAMPRPGDLLSLRLLQQDGLDWLALGADGLRLRLPAALGQQGDTVLVRVQLAQPRLELQLLERQPGAPSPVSSPAAGDGPAMHADQAWLHKLRPPPDAGSHPASLAAQWRSQVLAEVLRTVPAGVEMAAAPAAVFTLLGWQGQALLLRLVDGNAGAWPVLVDTSEEAARESPAAHEEGAGLSLCLSLSLGGEWVQILLQWRQGLLLHGSAAKPSALQALRGLMPRIASVLAGVPLKLLHCRLSLNAQPLAAANSTQQARGLAYASSGALFRAAAEITAVLQSA